MASVRFIACLTLCAVLKAEDLKDFDFSDQEIMIAQESRQYQTIVKPPVRIYKPNGITNSHRPQYNVDSEEDVRTSDDLVSLFDVTTKKSLEKGYRPFKLRAKEVMVRDAVLKALDRKDNVGRFAQILPIIRSMSGSQRAALAALVASQVTTPPGRSPLNLVQVRSMFGNNANTSSELMLPILLDMANLIRKAVRPGKESREVRLPQTLPQQQMLRRSFVESDDTLLNDELFETEHEEQTTSTTTKLPKLQQLIQNRSRGRNRVRDAYTPNRTETADHNNHTNDTEHLKKNRNTTPIDNRNTTRLSSSSTTTTTELSPSSSSAKPSSSSARPTSSSAKPLFANISRSLDNGTLDLTADSTNQTLAKDLPMAEKLRSFNRYVDKNGNVVRRGVFPKPALARRTTAEPAPALSRRPTAESAPALPRRRPPPPRTTPLDANCELFTNSLCLHDDDYPTDAIISSLRRNKAATGALLADYRDPGEGAVDGVTAAQEAKYTAEHYLVSNRRGDTANRDFAGAGEAGFMCPSTVKYARPQRARATSGQWKYIVNTGEHTQTLRLEKCLKPKESCTYLTDNFKSKCVQVYNYHRLLTWDQQNGLHMDIFKVPTCCSCHIEGYSVAFPPLGHRLHETSSEQFPGEDLSAEHGNGAFESVQPSIQRPSASKKPPFAHKAIDNFPSIGENHNLISSGIPSSNIDDNDNYNSGSSMDSYGNSYFPDSFNQASSIRNVKRPPAATRNPVGSSNFDEVTLPSYLEPPTPAATSSFSFVKEPPSKYKITNSNQYKRGPPRPSRRPLRKKISGAPDDLISSGTSAAGSISSSNIESLEDFNDDLEEPDVISSSSPPSKVTIAPKLQAIAPTSTTFKPPEQKKPVKKENHASNGKRVNYNYHPIIDFFDEDKDVDSIDREDIAPAYIPAVQSEWTPIDHPVSRNNNSEDRKKHK